MFVKRTIELPKKRSFFLFGPRLTGKSTLLKTYFPACPTVLYLDLLDTSQQIRYLQDPSTIYREVAAGQKQLKTIVVDEIQKAPDLLNEIQRLIEEYPHLQFIMSGSSARKLKKMRANLLGGRALTHYLTPLTFPELEGRFDFIKVLERGTLPVVYLEKDPQVAADILRSYVDTYLTEEIRQESLVRNLGAFLQFMPLAGEESGNILNFSNIGREIGISYKTVQEYFQILVDTLIIFFLPAYTRSGRKKMVQHPKFYFFDTGVLRAVKKELRLPLEKRTFRFGYYFEHFIINEVKRYNDYHKLDCVFYFSRTSDGQEIDLIVEKPGKRLLAVEIKAKDNPGKNDLKGLYSFKKLYPEAELILLTLVNREQVVDDIRILPWQKVYSLFSD